MANQVRSKEAKNVTLYQLIKGIIKKVIALIMEMMRNNKTCNNHDNGSDWEEKNEMFFVNNFLLKLIHYRNWREKCFKSKLAPFKGSMIKCLRVETMKWIINHDNISKFSLSLSLLFCHCYHHHYYQSLSTQFNESSRIWNVYALPNLFFLLTSFKDFLLFFFFPLNSIVGQFKYNYYFHYKCFFPFCISSSPAFPAHFQIFF